MTDEILTKLQIVESLQQKELRVYERFIMVLEKHIRLLLPNINQPDLLNEMMAAKRSMMNEIETIETELGPIRRELGQAYQDKVLDQVDQSRLEKVRQTDLTIISLISRISKSEQELTNRIQTQMEQIRERLQHSGHKKTIMKKYTPPKSVYPKSKPVDRSPSNFDSLG